LAALPTATYGDQRQLINKTDERIRKGADLEVGKDFELSRQWAEWATHLWVKKMGTPKGCYIDAVPYKLNLYGSSSLCFRSFFSLSPSLPFCFVFLFQVLALTLLVTKIRLLLL
jgi:hypothetical protein